jgi:hypothetical protein
LQALIVSHGIAESDQQMIQFALSVYSKAVVENRYYVFSHFTKRLILFFITKPSPDYGDY